MVLKSKKKKKKKRSQHLLRMVALHFASLIKCIKILLIHNFIVCYTASLNTVTALLE